MRASDYRLYLVTDSRCGGRNLEWAVAEAIQGGVTMVQWRFKAVPGEDARDQAQRMRALTRKHDVPLIINDHLDLALAVDADGLHVGQNDVAARDARRRLRPDQILGVSTQTVGEALKAQADGADYVGVGACFPTATKTDIHTITGDVMRSIKSAVSIPVVAIGGITVSNAREVWAWGVDGLAVVSALLQAPDIRAAARAFRALEPDAASD